MKIPELLSLFDSHAERFTNEGFPCESTYDIRGKTTIVILKVKRTRTPWESTTRGAPGNHTFTLKLNKGSATYTRVIKDVNRETGHVENHEDEGTVSGNLAELISAWFEHVRTIEQAAHDAAPKDVVVPRTPRTPREPSPQSERPSNTASSSSESVTEEEEVSPYPSAPALNKWLKISPNDPRMTWDIWPRVRYKNLDDAHREPSHDPVVIPVLTVRIRNMHGAMHRSACKRLVPDEDEK